MMSGKNVVYIPDLGLCTFLNTHHYQVEIYSPIQAHRIYRKVSFYHLNKPYECNEYIKPPIAHGFLAAN